MSSQVTHVSIIQHLMRRCYATIDGPVVKIDLATVGGIIYVLRTIGDDLSLFTTKAGQPCTDIRNPMMKIYLHLVPPYLMDFFIGGTLIDLIQSGNVSTHKNYADPVIS